MFTIHLNNMHFFAHHGLHDEESVTGNSFLVDVNIKFLPAEKISSIHQTINYAEAYTIIKKIMNNPVPLLETLAESIVAEIHAMDNRIREINVQISKLNPPIENFSGHVGVTFNKVFE
jgi:dihydroneopterin aldolase